MVSDDEAVRRDIRSVRASASPGASASSSFPGLDAVTQGSHAESYAETNPHGQVDEYQGRN
jgi:hypothetical protein